MAQACGLQRAGAVVRLRPSKWDLPLSAKAKCKQRHFVQLTQKADFHRQPLQGTMSPFLEPAEVPSMCISVQWS